ncbi:uncharacterized protein LOC111622591 [Centruroides sculpturatus]|uniref:uncharacterized protein LOC111622591 n=1 Tax=Centruroides sculpturatus TaxID=218467 RepID=UPI000C6EC11B|nr:uncharacterized protein LOC111622591 [Centruroides sculpturatus]
MSNELGLPNQGHVQIKKLVQKEKRKKTSIRIGTLNVGTLNGKSRELVDLIQRRVNILCLQETRWRGNKDKELGDGYNLFVSGVNKGGRNGVGIVIDKVLKDSVCSREGEKTNFWTDLDQVIMCVPMNERLNGHVGKRKNAERKVLGGGVWEKD